MVWGWRRGDGGRMVGGSRTRGRWKKRRPEATPWAGGQMGGAGPPRGIATGDVKGTRKRNLHELQDVRIEKASGGDDDGEGL